MAVFRLDSTIRDYDWGTSRAISDLLGRVPSGGPEAELWMGAHSAAPSPLSEPEATRGAKNLLELLEGSPALLGPRHERLPYLFKVLASASPLSLQVHPSMEQAQAGFEREQKEGVPLSAAHRCYKDPSHKPELMMAISPFAALCGFVPPELMSARLVNYGLLDEGSPLAADAARLKESYSPDSLSALFSRLFELTESELESALSRVRARVDADAACPVDAPEARQRATLLGLRPQMLQRFSVRLQRVHDKYPGDPGVLAALLLHWVELGPGDALYIPAGVMHSYLEGVGLEIMASSDNVLRGGMTSKHVSVSELQRTLRFTAQPPALIAARETRSPGGARLSTYETPSPEFQLSTVTLEGDASFTCLGPDVLLVLEGELEADSGRHKTRLRRGDQAYCSGDETYVLRGDARLARASPNDLREFSVV